jgi:hypothetical protein
LREEANNEGDRRDRKHGDVLLVIGVKVGPAMALGGLDEHPNNDPVKT